VPFKFEFNSSFSGDALVASQQVRLYIDGGESPHVGIAQNSGVQPAASYSVTVVGHLVDVP
jgi:hypothetical protein